MAEALHDEDEAEGEPVISAMAGSIQEMKALRDRCHAAGFPAEIGCPGGGRSCGPKTHLLIAERDLPKLAVLVQGDWRDSVEREGNEPIALQMVGEELPCPACGTAAPLVEGACSDCGLQLE